MFKKIAAVIPVLALVGAVGLGAQAYALDCKTPQDCASKGVDTADTGSKSDDVGTVIGGIVDLLLYLIGAVAVIMIVIGGFKYVVSNGEAAQVKSAKDTIFYAVIGLVVAILAYAIVHFVIGQFTKSVTPASSAQSQTKEETED